MAPRPPSPSRPELPSSGGYSWSMFVILGALLLGMWIWRSNIERADSAPVDYSLFYQWAEQGKLKSVTIQAQDVKGELKSPEKINGHGTNVFRTVLPQQDDKLLPLLRDKGVRIRVATEGQPFIVAVLISVLPWVLIIGLSIWLSRRAQRMMTAGGPLGSILKPRPRLFEKNSQVGVTFDDVAGLKAAKRDLEEIVEFLKEPARFRRLGGKVPRGVLLVGPPGTGKTLLARAVAGESGVPFFSISGSEFIEMFVGLGAARVRELFDEAKKSAPSIVFIDEIDAVGRSRGTGFGGGHDEREQTLNQLLSEMDGFSRRDLVVVMAATNRPDVLDMALLRPGRFDRRVMVDRPELTARRAILDVHVKGKPLASDVNLDDIARNTPGFSGAELENLVNEAALSATRCGADEVFARDFTAAYDKIVLGDERDAKLDPKERQRVVVHEAGHAVVAHYSTDAEPLHRVTIIPRGMALGVTQQTPAAERHIQTQPELEARLRVLMGGYAAERIIFGDVSTGTDNDLKEATRIASQMVAHWGMNKKLGAVYYEHQTEHPFLGQRIATDAGTSDATVSAIEREARTTLAEALRQADALIVEHRERFDRLTQALLDHETVEKDELATILGPALNAEGSASTLAAVADVCT